MKKKSAKNTKTERSVYQVFFARKNDFQKEIKKEYPKKLYALKAKDGLTYLLLGEQKIPFSEAVAFAIYDGYSSGYSNIVIPYKSSYIFARGSGDNRYSVEAIPKETVDNEGLSVYAEGYFKGYAYKIGGSLNHLKKIHLKKDYMALKIIGVLVLLIALLLAYAIEQRSSKEIMQKAPKPMLPPITKNEEFSKKREISKLAISKVLDLASSIAKAPDQNITNSVKTTRLSMIQMPVSERIAQQDPYYDEAANMWIYDDENKKRGGLSLNMTIGFEKRYPDEGYRKKDNHIYYKDEILPFDVLFNPNGEEKISLASVNIKCINKAFELASIEERDANNIHFTIKEDLKGMKSYDILARLNDLVKNCPVYIEDLYLSGNEHTGNFYLYYDFSNKGK